jgi:AraC-like DNA-binding protein/quercetin dioxygenase-like cupin family protein
MSLNRQAPRADALALGPFSLARGQGFDQHEHDQHQLAWTSSGVLTMGTTASTWVLPPSRALWIPAAVPHTVAVAVASAQMYSLYFTPEHVPVHWSVPTVIAVSPLLGELIVHLADRRVHDAPRRRAEALVFDLLEPVDVAPLRTQVPTDGRARFVADALTADPADARTLAEWGRAAGASERTLSRRFVEETGLSFTEWRTQTRLVAALPQLADGATVAAVSHQVGYANPSAFIAAFRRVFGVTPGAYFCAPN